MTWLAFLASALFFLAVVVAAFASPFFLPETAAVSGIMFVVFYTLLVGLIAVLYGSPRGGRRSLFSKILPSSLLTFVLFFGFYLLLPAFWPFLGLAYLGGLGTPIALAAYDFACQDEESSPLLAAEARWFEKKRLDGEGGPSSVIGEPWEIFEDEGSGLGWVIDPTQTPGKFVALKTTESRNNLAAWMILVFLCFLAFAVVALLEGSGLSGAFQTAFFLSLALALSVVGYTKIALFRLRMQVFAPPHRFLLLRQGFAFGRFRFELQNETLVEIGLTEASGWIFLGLVYLRPPAKEAAQEEKLRFVHRIPLPQGHEGELLAALTRLALRWKIPFSPLLPPLPRMPSSSAASESLEKNP